MFSKDRADQISAGVFLVGLGVLFTGILDFWPGILFVIGASTIARGMTEGRAWYNVTGGLWMIALGIIFLFNFSWPMILIMIGIAMLFGYKMKEQHEREYRYEDGYKSKNDEKRKHDDLESSIV